MKCLFCGSEETETFYPKLAFNARTYCKSCRKYIPYISKYWSPLPRADGRMEWMCIHGVGHGNHVHGCDGCCSRHDYPGVSGELNNSSIVKRIYHENYGDE
jgi:hypothetical protein